MKKRWVLLVFVAIFLIYTVSAQDENVLLTLKDINTNTEVDSVAVTLDFGNNNIISPFVEEGEILRLNLENKTYIVEFKVDKTLTDGKDYYTKETLNVETSLVKGIFLYPVGSIRGIVKDKLDNVVSNAKLKFECSGADLVQFPQAADEFGSFSIDYMPVGSCKIFANYKGGIGFTDINIEQGSLNDIEIKLDKSIVYPDKVYIWTVIIILLILGVIIVLIAFRGKIFPKKEEKPRPAEKKIEAEIKLGKRARDVLETLPEKQKEVIEFIVQENGKTTQNKIRQETGIPKSSLFRHIQALEHKKVIDVKKVGKVKKIKFSDWFLGKEEEKPEPKIPESST
jgi:uncharacterized membrane protein